MLKQFTKTVRLPIRKKPISVAFSLERYHNGNTAVMIYKPKLLGYEEWDVLTVNTDTVLSPDCACIDTNHHGEDIIDCLKQLGLGEATGLTCTSGFCKYPVFKLDIEKIKRYCVPADAILYD